MSTTNNNSLKTESDTEISTPFGQIQIFVDNTAVVFCHSSIAPDKRRFPDVDGVHRISLEIKNDDKSHTIQIRLTNCDVEGDIESGELLEAISFYKNNGKITLGCRASFDDNLDYNGFYLSDGIQIDILPTTQTEVFEFGVCWLIECTDENEVQTWYGADPSI